MEKISVIIPVYKVEPYLRQCLDSVVNQTYKNLEIIVVDDGSPDNCGAICDEYAARDKRVRLVHQANKGLSAARNVGLGMATGKWISFVDSDDWCEPDMYENAIASAEENDADITIYGAYRNTENGQYLFQKYPAGFVTRDPEIIHQLQLSCICNLCDPFHTHCTQGLPWDKLFKASLIYDHGLRFPEHLRAEEDRIFGLNAFQFAKSVSYLDMPIYHFRYNTTGIGTKYTPNRPKTDRAVYEELLAIGEKYDLEREYYDVCKAFYITEIVLQGRRCVFHKENKPLSRQLRQAKEILGQEMNKEMFAQVDKRYLGKKGRIFIGCRHGRLFVWYLLACVDPLKEKILVKIKTL